MSYCKIVVDNPTCSRRFHLAFDDTAEPVAHTEIKCSFCDKIIYSADQHPAVRMLRQENLVNTSVLSDNLVQGCEYIDKFSVKTIPNSTEEQFKLYK